MMANRKSWGDLSEKQKRGLSVAMAVQVVLLIAALTDIARRPKNEIRGAKAGWALGSLVNFVGPISYFVFGRRR